MAITVGTDTYITVEEADTIIANTNVSTNAQRIAWEELSVEADKEIYLKNATQQMEVLKYRGCKFEVEQTLAFPRCFKQMVGDIGIYRNNILVNPPFHYGFYCQSDVPDDVKESQAFEALELASPSNDTASSKVASGNIKGFSTVGFSEQYRLGDKTDIDSIIFSNRAKNNLRTYTGGGFRIV